MRLLYIFRSIALWGGIERILVDKMNYLSEVCGFDIYLLTSDQGSHPVTYNLTDRVHHEDFDICFFRQYQSKGLKRLFIAYKMLRKYEDLLSNRLKQIQPDIIITTTSDRLHSITKLKGAVPLIVESHSVCTRTIDDGRNLLIRKINRYLYLHCLPKIDAIISLTKRDADEWRNFHPNVFVIPNFVHHHEECMSSNISKKVIFVGRFDYQKRPQDAIRIWKIVRERHPDWVLELYGDGEMKREVCELASSIGGILIHHPINNIFERYQTASFLISTSLFEPFGLVITEAMSCGLPVIAFDCPYGPSELIKDKYNGFLIKERDFCVFADRICDLIENVELRKIMGKNAKLVSKRFDEKSVMLDWINMFNSLL